MLDPYVRVAEEEASLLLGPHHRVLRSSVKSVEHPALNVRATAKLWRTASNRGGQWPELVGDQTPGSRNRPRRERRIAGAASVQLCFEARSESLLSRAWYLSPIAGVVTLRTPLSNTAHEPLETGTRRRPD